MILKPNLGEATQQEIAIGRGVLDNEAPKPGEHELWAWLENLAEESDRVRKEEARMDMFDKYLDIYHGKHWSENMPSYKPPVVVNELRTLILSEASDLSESQLRMYVTKDPRLGGRDEDVERAIRAVWARNQIDLKLVYAACWALIVGTGFLRVQWDPNATYGLGDVVVDDIDPRYVLPDPDAMDDRRWSYVIVENTLDLMEIRSMFPTAGWRVKPEQRWSVRDRNSSGQAPDNITSNVYSGPMSDSTLVGKGVYGYKKARARVLDCFVKDDSVEITVDEEKDIDGRPILGEDGNPILRQRRVAKYPHGRRIIGANGIILFDGPNPNPNGDFGLLRVILEPALGTFWSRGFVQQTMELQLAADKMMSGIVENSLRLNNGIVVATTNTGVDWESYSAIPGQIVQINQGSQFDIKYPNAMPADMVQAPWRMLDMQRRLLGFPDPRAGVSGRGNTSAELTETEISQAQAPTRLRGRMLYHTVQRLAEMIFARMAHGYLTERVIPAVEGESFKPVTWKPLDKPERYNIYVDPASFQVMSKTMLRRIGMALFKMRAIDRKSLLESIGWPNWQQMAMSMDQADQEVARLKALKGRNR